jgi:positive regulator of sigma E activity
LKKLYPEFGCKFNELTFSEFIALLKQFAKAFEVMVTVFPGKSENNPSLLRVRTDWAANYILNPSFFDEQLKERVTNSILVAALLVTITASTFLNPPDFGVESEDINYRSFNFLMFVSTICFIISILTGITFIEDGMDRSFTQSDRVHSTLKYYKVIDMSANLMYLGSILLTICLVLAAKLRNQEDTTAYSVILAFLGVSFILLKSWTSQQTTKQQTKHIDMFQYHLCDQSSGKIRVDIMSFINTYDSESDLKVS